MEVEGIVASRHRGKEREFLVKWKELPEPIWQPESNLSLKEHYDQYFEMMNCTFDYFPTLMARKLRPKVDIDLDQGELAVTLKGKRVKDLRGMSVEEKRLVLGELEAICHLAIKRQK
jgi:hypothetical protein